MSTNSKKRCRSPSSSPGIDGSDNCDEIPKEFFCPISKRFMSDPVIILTSDITYDRDSVKDSHKPEDVQPDLIMRKKMEEWLSRFDLKPPFNVDEEEFLQPALNSVLKERKLGLLQEFTKMVRSKRLLMIQGRPISLAARLILSHPNPSAAWISNVVSLFAGNDILEVPPGIRTFSDYSLLDPISRACESESENEEFQMGLVNFMYTFAIMSGGIDIKSSLVARKLEAGIIKTLVSYMWPVKEHFIPNRHYSRLLMTLDCLSENKRCCRCMIDSEIIEMLFIILDFGVSSIPGIIENPNKASAALALRSESGQFIGTTRSLIILDRLCLNSERARSRIAQMVEGELTLLHRAMDVSTDDNDAISAGLRVLGHYGDNSGHNHLSVVP